MMAGGSEVPEKVLQEDVKRHQERFKLEKIARRLKKKLGIEPGARPEPVPLVEELVAWQGSQPRCQTCSPCSKVDCGACRACLVKGTLTRRQKAAAEEGVQDRFLGLCQDPAR